MTDSERKIKIGSYGSDHIEIKGLKRGEVELVEGSIRGGFHWIRVDTKDGLQSVPNYKSLPDPILDQEMHPFWRRPTPSEIQISEGQLKLFDLGEMPDYNSPSITISSLCGYHYTPENYAIEAEKLISYGFICMRSKRGDDGRFWEHWFLPGLRSAKGNLEEAITHETTRFEKDRLRKALYFLKTNVSFGSLDASVQRVAMVIDD